jgi:hypothetical protein
MEKGTAIPSLNRFTSVFQGFYARVARRLHVNPSYVSRVARGEWHSPRVAQALDQEMRRSLKLVTINLKGSRQHGPRRKYADVGGANTQTSENRQIA